MYRDFLLKGFLNGRTRSRKPGRGVRKRSSQPVRVRHCLCAFVIGQHAVGTYFSVPFGLGSALSFESFENKFLQIIEAGCHGVLAIEIDAFAERAFIVPLIE